MKSRRLPDWLRLWIQHALVGEVYPEIRAIAVGFSDSRALTIRAYLDREPTDEDRESLSCIVTEIFANTSSSDEIRSVSEECVFATTPFEKLDALDGLVYARREYLP